MPFSRQIRSNMTSTGWGPNRPVKHLPLSVRISSGMPKRRSDAPRTAHTALEVALVTRPAAMQNRLWSSTPVTTFPSAPF
jgi:hypothetical protein